MVQRGWVKALDGSLFLDYTKNSFWNGLWSGTNDTIYRWWSHEVKGTRLWYLDSRRSLVDGVESREQPVGRDHQQDRERHRRYLVAELKFPLPGSRESKPDRIPFGLIRVERNFRSTSLGGDPLKPVQLIFVLSAENADLRNVVC